MLTDIIDLSVQLINYGEFITALALARAFWIINRFFQTIRTGFLMQLFNRRRKYETKHAAQKDATMHPDLCARERSVCNCTQTGERDGSRMMYNPRGKIAFGVSLKRGERSFVTSVYIPTVYESIARRSTRAISASSPRGMRRFLSSHVSETHNTGIIAVIEPYGLLSNRCREGVSEIIFASVFGW